MYQKIILKILGLFDFFYQKKINNFLKKKKYKKFKIFFDVGAHKGESINKFLSIFDIESIYSFEASPVNFSELEKKLGDFKKKFSKTNIVIENIALGDKENIVKLKQLSESSSSTISEINTNSVYFKRKIKSLFYLKENRIISKSVKKVKIFGVFEVSQPMHVKGIKVTHGAKESIEKAGGTVDVVNERPIKENLKKTSAKTKISSTKGIEEKGSN